MPSTRFSLNKADLISILKVIGWTVASALVAAVIVALGNINVPAQYLFLVPIVNTLLVAIQKFVAGKAAADSAVPPTAP
jgi:hypothetical protein